MPVQQKNMSNLNLYLKNKFGCFLAGEIATLKFDILFKFLIPLRFKNVLSSNTNMKVIQRNSIGKNEALNSVFLRLIFLSQKPIAKRIAVLK